MLEESTRLDRWVSQLDLLLLDHCGWLIVFMVVALLFGGLAGLVAIGTFIFTLGLDLFLVLRTIAGVALLGTFIFGLPGGLADWSNQKAGDRSGSFSILLIFVCFLETVGLILLWSANRNVLLVSVVDAVLFYVFLELQFAHSWENTHMDPIGVFWANWYRLKLIAIIVALPIVILLLVGGLEITAQVLRLPPGFLPIFFWPTVWFLLTIAISFKIGAIEAGEPRKLRFLN